MFFSPGTFGRLLGGGSQWILKASKDAVPAVLRLSRGGPYTEIPLISVRSISVDPGAIWADIKLVAGDTTYNLDGLQNDDANRLLHSVRQLVRERLATIVLANEGDMSNMTQGLQNLLDEERYLSNYDLRSLIATFGEVGEAAGHPFFDSNLLPKNLQHSLFLLTDLLSPDRTMLKERNAKFVELELTREAEFFDTIESRPLTQEQRRAAIVLEDRNLVVAAAGSGKTSVIVAKVGYVLRKGLCKPEEILLLTFNKDAQKELTERIQNSLTPILGGDMPNIKTFHALGLEILTEATDRKPLVC